MTVLQHGSGWVGLTAAIVDKAPALPGAACVGKEQLFDPPHGRESTQSFEARKKRARQVCAGCPVVDSCAEWVGTIGRARVSGILPVNPRRRQAA